MVATTCEKDLAASHSVDSTNHVTSGPISNRFPPSVKPDITDEVLTFRIPLPYSIKLITYPSLLAQ